MGRMKLCSILCLLTLCMRSGVYGAQLEAGINYDFRDLSPVISIDLFPLTISESGEEVRQWTGLALHGSYFGGNWYSSIMYGSAEYFRTSIHTIFIGPEICFNNISKVGICLKGTTCFWNFLPFSLVVDPKYDFRDERFIWDLKCTVGIGNLKPLDQLLGRN